ncbi:MAG: AAA family ATPase [Bacillota bacterium]|nr:AAA family ATPase [Bacillota bacterium]
MQREAGINEIVYNIDLEISQRGADKRIPEYEQVYDKIREAFEIDRYGYNIYLIDQYSKEKLANLMDYTTELLKQKSAPKDICYVTCEDDKAPKCLIISSGKGELLKNKMQQLKKEYSNITFDFYNSPVNKEKETILENLQKNKNELIGELVDIASKEGFEIKATQYGFNFIPLNKGELMTETEYDVLKADEKEVILEKINRLKQHAKELLDLLHEMERNEVIKVREIMRKYFDEEMKKEKEEVEHIFNDDNEVLNFLLSMCKNIEEKLIESYSTSYDEDEETITKIIDAYVINILVDNSALSCPRVLFEEDPNVANLLGSIDYENHNGTYVTDINFIKSGSMLRANEGCLIIRINSLLTNPASYYYLKRSLISENVKLDYNRGYLELLSINGLHPEPVSIREKVILIGDYETYDFLYNYDEDFRTLFKVKAEYKPVVDIDDRSKISLIQGVEQTCRDHNLKPVTKEAMKQIAKFLSRKAEHRNKFYFSNEELNNLLIRADNLSNGGESIEANNIISVAYKEDIIEKEVREVYGNNKILIDVKKGRIGQVNGLSVIDSGYFSFGKPIRITCTCYKGDGNIIDVQKENQLSGSIHSKSINILKGCINEFIGGYGRIPVDFHLSFEQLYGKIEGDSASIAEIISMISALSKIPVKQNIAVTGSINQFGEVQPIGGVNEKIEGFYKICNLIDKATGKGVLIPERNIDNIILNDEVEGAITAGDFHIYTMSSLKDAINILMGTKTIDDKAVLAAVKKEIRKYSYKRKTEI